MNNPLAFDAKLYSFRRAKDGIIFSVVVHPTADCISALAILPIGAEMSVAIGSPQAGPTVSPSASETATERMASRKSEAGGEKQRRRYRDGTEGEKAVARAAMLCKDAAFQEWMTARLDAAFNDGERTKPDEDFAAHGLRAECEIASRAEIAINPEALKKFLALELEFNQAVGRAAKDIRA